MLLAAVALTTLLHAAPQGKFCVGPDRSHGLFSPVLSAHVRDGVVDYTALRKTPAPLDDYIATLESTCVPLFEKLPREDKLAFLINGYNAAVLRLVLAHPGVGSIEKMEGGQAFKKPVIQLGPFIGSAEPMVSLDALETAIRKLGEPRIHFALVCAAKSCPKLRSEPYTGATLDKQLEAQTKSFLESPHGVVVEKGGAVVKVSKLFEWYATDFGGVRKFLGRYRPELAADSGGYQIAFLPYDWSLNGR